jgi:hypothetical protein
MELLGNASVNVNREIILPSFLSWHYLWHTYSDLQSPFRAIGQHDITAVPTHNRACDGHTESDTARLAAA